MAKWALCFGYFSFLLFDTAFLGFFRVGRLQITDTFEVANFSIFGNLHIRNFCVPNTRIFESPFRIHNSLMISRLQDVEIMSISIFEDPDSLPLLKFDTFVGPKTKSHQNRNEFRYSGIVGAAWDLKGEKLASSVSEPNCIQPNF